MPTDTLPELLDFRGAYGRMCVLAALALQREGVARDDVREALHGEAKPTLRELSLQRVRVTETTQAYYHAAGKVGVTRADGTKNLVRVAREVRDAVEGEWGHGGSTWNRLGLPLGPNP